MTRVENMSAQEFAWILLILMIIAGMIMHLVYGILTECSYKRRNRNGK